MIMPIHTSLQALNKVRLICPEKFDDHSKLVYSTGNGTVESSGAAVLEMRLNFFEFC